MDIFFSATKSRGQGFDLTQTAELGRPTWGKFHLIPPSTESVDVGVPPAGPLSSPGGNPLTVPILARSC